MKHPLSARLKKQRHLSALALALLAGCGSSGSDNDSGAWGSAQAADCAGLAAVTTADSTVTAAVVVTAGTVVQGQTAPVDYCRVQGVARPSSDSEIKWDVWLPLGNAAWTGRLKVNGTGGFAGSTPFARLNQDIGDGFVTAGSNMGHDGGESPDWTLGRPEKVKDWGLRAHYSVATAAKALAAAYYGAPVKYAYFEGCSNGGRQAMMMAQNYPELFDGIVAGAANHYYPDLLMWLLWAGKTLTPTAPGGPPSISPAKQQAITQRALQACDADDGLTDGQITNPRTCRFNIDSMGPSGDGTLSASELAAAKAMYSGIRNETTGALRYTGAVPGSEADWSPVFADNGGYGRFIGHAVYSTTSPPYDWRRDVNFNTVHDHVKTVLTPVTAAPSPDLSRFVRRGGKLLQTHGWNDSISPPESAIGYFYALTQFERLQWLTEKRRSVNDFVKELTPQAAAVNAVAYAQKVKDYYRLFMVPAGGHCGGSTGPSAIGGGMTEPPAAFRNADHHSVSAVMRWVEQGVAPDKLVATKFNTAGALVRSRPLCNYPSVAVYNGNGSVDDAASFTCSAPQASDYVVTDGDMVYIRYSLTQRALILPNR